MAQNEKPPTTAIAEGLIKQSLLNRCDIVIIAESTPQSIRKLFCTICGDDLDECITPSDDGRCQTCVFSRPEPKEGRTLFRGENGSPLIFRTQRVKRRPVRGGSV